MTRLCEIQTIAFQYVDYEEFVEESDVELGTESGPDKDDADFEPKKRKYAKRVCCHGPHKCFCGMCKLKALFQFRVWELAVEVGVAGKEAACQVELVHIYLAPTLPTVRPLLISTVQCTITILSSSTREQPTPILTINTIHTLEEETRQTRRSSIHVTVRRFF